MLSRCRRHVTHDCVHVTVAVCTPPTSLLSYCIPCQNTDYLYHNCCRIVGVTTYTHAGVFVEFLVGLRPRTLGRCFLRSRPIQHIILPDLHRHVGIGGVFFHMSSVELLQYGFPAVSIFRTLPISFHYHFFSLFLLCVHTLYFYGMMCLLSYLTKSL